MFFSPSAFTPLSVCLRTSLSSSPNIGNVTILHRDRANLTHFEATLRLMELLFHLSCGFGPALLLYRLGPLVKQLTLDEQV